MKQVSTSNKGGQAGGVPQTKRASAPAICRNCGLELIRSVGRGLRHKNGDHRCSLYAEATSLPLSAEQWLKEHRKEFVTYRVHNALNEGEDWEEPVLNEAAMLTAYAAAIASCSPTGPDAAPDSPQ